MRGSGERSVLPAAQAFLGAVPLPFLGLVLARAVCNPGPGALIPQTLTPNPKAFLGLVPERGARRSAPPAALRLSCAALRCSKPACSARGCSKGGTVPG